MTRFIQTILLTLLIGYSLSLAGQPGPIKNLRYDDDFSYLLIDTIQPKGLEKLKYMPLSKTGEVRVSLGGELREWYELRRNSNFGDTPPGFVEDKNGALQQRVMLHGDLELGKRWRVFGQLNITHEFGNKNEPVPEIIVDGIGVHQYFLQYNFGKSQKNFIRVGRQEWSFGNELLISSREGPNNRQAFDGVTIGIKRDNSSYSFFGGTPVIINPDAFDNTHVNEWVYGMYGQFRQNKKAKLDAYYLGFYSERRAYNFVQEKENRHTLGTRLFNHSRSWFYEAEAMLQVGSFGKQNILAGNFTGELRYVFQNVFLKPMIGIGASYVTGDYDPNDNALNTYNPLYPKPVYGLATPQGPSNIAHIKPTVGIQPSENLFVNFGWYYLARTSVHDGTYSPGMTQVRPFPDSESDKHGVGIQYGLDVFYVVNQNLTFLLFTSYVTPAGYVKETGEGKNTYFLAAAAQFKF